MERRSPECGGLRRKKKTSKRWQEIRKVSWGAVAIRPEPIERRSWRKRKNGEGEKKEGKRRKEDEGKKDFRPEYHPIQGDGKGRDLQGEGTHLFPDDPFL